MTQRPEWPEGPVPTSAADRADPGIAGLTEEILPALIARLRASRLGELEVRTAGWRVRLRRDVRASRRSSPGTASDGDGSEEVDEGGNAVRSPAVGYFTPLADIRLGQLVQAGDPLGSVDVLGIAQDVLAPVGGIVRAVLAEPGQAVEYGQPLVEIDVLAVDAEGAEDEVLAADAEPTGPSAEPGGEP